MTDEEKFGITVGLIITVIAFLFAVFVPKDHRPLTESEYKYINDQQDIRIQKWR